MKGMGRQWRIVLVTAIFLGPSAARAAGDPSVAMTVVPTVGMFLALGLILIKAPSPMLIAVGMYLPFESTSAIFVGGVIKWILDVQLQRRQATAEERTRAENTGTLLSSGFIAGESLMAVVLAFIVIGGERFPALLAARDSLTGGVTPSFWLGLLVYPALLYFLVWTPLQKMKSTGIPSVKAD